MRIYLLPREPGRRLTFLLGICLLILPWVAVAGSGPASDGEVALDALCLPPVAEQPWRFEGFPIVAWWGPPGTASVADFERYRDAGFTLYAANPDEGFERAIRYTDEVGLPVMAFRRPQGFGLAAREVEYPTDADSLVGWLTNDEPGEPAAVIESIRAVHRLMTGDPSRRALFNMLPPFAQPAPGTEAIIDAAVRNGLPILSFDHYIMMADGVTRDQAHFDHLELFRRKSLEHDRPFWAFALTTRHHGYRRPSESDVRYKQFTNLAYGAKGLWYFTYWGPTDWDHWDHVAIVDPADGSPTDLYGVVKAINLAVLDAGDILLGLESTEVVHTRPPRGGRRFRPGESWIWDLEARDVLVGFFEDGEGAQYALVVNKQHGPGKTADETADTVTLVFAPGVRDVEALSWLDGPTGSLPLEGGAAELRIGGGTGVLLRARVDPAGQAKPIARIVREGPEPDAASTERIVRKVADWQLDHMTTAQSAGWIRGAFLTGLMAAWRATDDASYYDRAVEFADRNQWKLGSTLKPRHADDHCVGQTYVELYEVDPEPERIADVRDRFDWVMAHAVPGREDYWWCDALFMAPPAYARLSKVTGDPRYVDFVTGLWKDSTEFLFDREERLYYRDQHWFDRKTPNGKPVFWSRGNGWAFAGLVRVLQYLPEDHAARGYYRGLFGEMADKIVRIQDKRDGLWRSSLLDPDSCAHPEASGSGFFCFGLAWGVNEGILDDPRYAQAARRAWKGLTACVDPDGALGYVQPVGGAPAEFAPDSTHEYGVGAFLLAGEEMLKLLEGGGMAMDGVRLETTGAATVPGTVEIEGVEACAFRPAWWTSGSLHWVRDARWPLIVPEPGRFRNIYAPSSVEIPGEGYRVFFGGWDGVPTGNDRIYSVTTRDFLEFHDRHTVIEYGDFTHVCNVNGIRLDDGAYRIMCTGLPADSDRNKPVVFASPDGARWNDVPAPYAATLDDIIEITGYADYEDADINGMNVLFRENGKYHVYFGDFRRFGQVHRAVGEDGTRYRYEGAVLDGRFAVNDVKKFITGDCAWYLMGLHMNGPELTYAVSTDPARFETTRRLFSHAGPEDRYIVAIGWVTKGEQEEPGRKVLGVLYGAGAVPALNENRIFARWLQKRIVFTPRDGNPVEGTRALGPDRQVLELADPETTEGTLSVIAEDGRTRLAELPVSLEPGRAYRLIIPGS